jgi:hypothetical protein
LRGGKRGDGHEVSILMRIGYGELAGRVASKVSTMIIRPPQHGHRCAGEGVSASLSAALRERSVEAFGAASSGLMDLLDIAKAPVSRGVEPHDLETGSDLRVPPQPMARSRRRSPLLPRERFRFYGARGGRWRLRRGNQTMERPYVKAERLEQMPGCA